jgi:hypothetical protein
VKSKAVSRLRLCTRRLKHIAAVGFLVSAVALISGCAAKRVDLTPAPNAMLASLPDSAQAQTDGVQVTVEAEAWNGFPRDLDYKLTPLKVTIKNNSGHPLSVRYKDFDLVTGTDQRYAALPPFEIRGNAYAHLGNAPELGNKPRFQLASLNMFPGQTEHPPDHPQKRIDVVPEFGWSNFYVAPYWGYVYPGLGYWPGWWGPADWGYFGAYYPYMEEVHLPTRSMLRKAIPEGVVGNDGSVSGFMYFQKVKAEIQQPVMFEAKLVDADNHQQFGTISIPFIATSR